MRTAFTNALTLHRLCLRSMIERHEAQNGFIHRLMVVTGQKRFIFEGKVCCSRFCNDTLLTHRRPDQGICRVDIRGQGWVVL